MTNKDNLILGGIIIAVILVVILSLLGLYYSNSQKINSGDKIETLTLTYSDNLVSETSNLERNKILKQVKINTEGQINLDLSQILAQTATTSCIFYQKIFFEGEEIDFNHVPSEEEKEYLRKMNEFIGEYTITQVLVEIHTINGNEGFVCSLNGNDKTQNTMILIGKDNTRYTLTLNQAEEQYLN